MSACSENDSLLRQMVQQGESLTAIAGCVGTSRRHVKAYILRHKIPHQPFRRGGPKGAKNGRWKGGETVDKDGYLLVKSHGHPYADRHNYVRKHRLVMEEHLGRYLEPQEVVHHKNDDKLDNSLENLKLYPDNATHLAETLKGQVPQWTDDGKRRIRAGVERSAAKRRKANRHQSEPDDPA